MVINARTAAIPVMGAALAFQAVGCKKDKNDVKTDLLVGEWEVVLIDGQPPEDNEYSENHITFEFQSDKDFRFCYKYVYSSSIYSDCYTGEWQWADSDQDEIQVYWKDEGEDEIYEGQIEVATLTKDEMTGDFTYDNETHFLEFERVD